MNSGTMKCSSSAIFRRALPGAGPGSAQANAATPPPAINVAFFSRSRRFREIPPALCFPAPSPITLIWRKPIYQVVFLSPASRCVSIQVQAPQGVREDLVPNGVLILGGRFQACTRPGRGQHVEPIGRANGVYAEHVGAIAHDDQALQ